MNKLLFILCFVILKSTLLIACATDAPYKRKSDVSVVSTTRGLDSGYHCENAERFRGQVVGTGHCVSLIQICTDAPRTVYWKPGNKVKGNDLEPGTIIATFNDGRYPNKTGWHAAIYIDQNDQGILVWDQWKGKPVHKRLIRYKGGIGTANNDGDAYSVVR